MPTARARSSNWSKRPQGQTRRTSEGDARILAIGPGMSTSPSTCSADPSDSGYGEDRLTQVAATAASTWTHCATRHDRHRSSPLRCEKRCPPPVSAGLTASATNARPTITQRRHSWPAFTTRTAADTRATRHVRASRHPPRLALRLAADRQLPESRLRRVPPVQQRHAPTVGPTGVTAWLD